MLTKTIQINNVEWRTSGGVLANASVARLDLLHPVVSGNKFFKLKYNLQQAKTEGKGIMTMGGAYSNHLAATAFACYEAGIPSIGLVRGELTEPLNHTLSFCKQHQMKLMAVPRHLYNRTSAYIQTILAEHENYSLIPEGGDNTEGEKGCSEIASCIPGFTSFTHIACAAGTGTTARGLAQSLLPHQTLLVIPVLKIKQEEQHAFLQQHLSVHNHHQLQTHFDQAGKGYASKEPDLFACMNTFYQQTGIPLDFVYTAKLIRAITHLFSQQYFKVNDHVLIIHTGGLQGNESLPKGTLLY